MNLQHGDCTDGQLKTRDQPDALFGHILGKRQHARFTPNVNMHGPGKRVSRFRATLSEPCPLSFHEKSVNICLHVNLSLDRNRAASCQRDTDQE
jgi:hypothetical protein